MKCTECTEHHNYAIIIFGIDQKFRLYIGVENARARHRIVCMVQGSRVKLGPPLTISFLHLCYILVIK